MVGSSGDDRAAIYCGEQWNLAAEFWIFDIIVPDRSRTRMPEEASQPTFEADMARLEAIVSELDAETCGLADAMRAYEEGVRLAQRCISRLGAAEQRVEELRLELESSNLP